MTIVYHFRSRGLVRSCFIVLCNGGTRGFISVGGAFHNIHLCNMGSAAHWLGSPFDLGDLFGEVRLGYVCTSLLHFRLNKPVKRKKMNLC